MKALLDTNIIIHRESGKTTNQDIGILYKWLDKTKYEKCVHPVTIAEIEKNPNQETVRSFLIKLDSYNRLLVTAPWAEEVTNISTKQDISDNDKNDSTLLNEVFTGRVDILITEDKKIHQKADGLGISDRVHTINSFLEKAFAEHPDLVNYKVLGVKQKLIGELDLNDPFFDSLKEDYFGFDKWFQKKASEIAYVTINHENNRILSFLFLKTEGKEESYPDIVPPFGPKKRLKVGTFKVVSNGVRLGERFMKIIFDNALAQKAEEIYVTIFDKRAEQGRLIDLLVDWGFKLHGTKGDNGELVYVRDFFRRYNPAAPKTTYPFFGLNTKIFLIPIYPDYHTDLLPDSYLKTESATDYIDDEPHRNALSKVYISRSFERGIGKGDIMIFYRTASGGSAKHTAVITTIAICEGTLDHIKDESDFISKCRKRSVFSDEKLREHWRRYPDLKPFIINFLYVYSFRQGKRLNRHVLLDLGILTDAEKGPRGLTQISKEQFLTILQHTDTDESLIVH